MRTFENLEEFKKISKKICKTSGHPALDVLVHEKSLQSLNKKIFTMLRAAKS